MAKQTKLDIEIEAGVTRMQLVKMISEKIRTVPTSVWTDPDAHKILLTVNKQGPTNPKPTAAKKKPPK